MDIAIIFVSIENTFFHFNVEIYLCRVFKFFLLRIIVTSRVQFEMKEHIFMDIYKISTLYFLFYCFFIKIINGNSIYVRVRMSWK